MNPKLTSTQAQIITTAEGKANERIDTSSEDTLVDRKLLAAQLICQNYCQRSLITSTWQYYLDDFAKVIRIPLLGVTSVDSIQYYDTDDAIQTLATTEYNTELNGEPVRIIAETSWPSTYDKHGAVIVTFTAGYADAASVPDDVKEAILLVFGALYQKREDSVHQLPTASEYLLAPYAYEYFV
jgi:uncharacterized phiE125 gp8 family phage protein